MLSGRIQKAARVLVLPLVMGVSVVFQISFILVVFALIVGYTATVVGHHAGTVLLERVREEG